jgi:DNA-binding NtrC family response regulator
MIDSELFGHLAGSFPGAVADRRGRIDVAMDGTLFLAEVASLPLTSQTRLADFLDNQTKQPINMISRPARIIASTTYDLEARTREGKFRVNLLARLGLVRLQVPPLRERVADIALLAMTFGSLLAAANGLPVRRFSDEALALLLEHDWPGNIRELEDVVHRAVLISNSDVIAASAIIVANGNSLPCKRQHGVPQVGQSSIGDNGKLDSLVGSKMEDVERALILETLKACRGNRTSASTILGISVRTMRNKLKTFIEAGISV